MPRPAPVTSRELQAALEGLGVEMRPARAGFVVATVNGTEVKFHGARDAIVNKDTLRRIAQASGAASYSDFLASVMDRAPMKAGRPAPVVPDAPRAVTKREAVAACESLRLALLSVEGWLRKGSHSPHTYGRVHDAALLASESLAHWMPGIDTWESPDDAGYVPTRPDSLTTGVARVAGVAVAAVRRDEAITQWEHGELSARMEGRAR